MLIGFGILVAATGDRLIDKWLTKDLIYPGCCIVFLLFLSSCLIYKQYMNNPPPVPGVEDHYMTCGISLFAILFAAHVKHKDWSDAYSFSRRRP